MENRVLYQVTWNCLYCITAVFTSLSMGIMLSDEVVFEIRIIEIQFDT